MWLLESQTMQAMRAAEVSGFQPSAEQQAQLVAVSGFREDGTPRIMSKAGGTARIEVRGVLTDKPNILAMLFGGGNTVYSDIISAVSMAEQDSEIKDIELFFDTPGGSVAGMFDAMVAVQSAKKPTTARLGASTASAGYMLAAMADELVAENRASQVGSFGVAVQMRVDESIVDITNSESPDKRPDASTPEGRAVIQEYLDAVYDLMADEVAAARGVTRQKITTDFGRGAMLLAEEAVKRGMIDRVDGGDAPALRVVSQSTPTASNGGDEPEASKMDLEKLKAEHPALFAQVVKIGQDSERDRVCAFVEAGKVSGDMETALTAITEGSEMTQTLQMKFLMAGRNNADINARQDEGDDTPDTPAAGNPDASDKDFGDIVAEQFDKGGVTFVDARGDQ